MRIRFVLQRVIGTVLAVCVLASVGAGAELRHRYSFDGDCRDSAGGADGVLVENTGRAAYANGSLILGNDGSQHSADSDGDYVDLPNGVISALGTQATFECWATWLDATGGAWQELMSFGTSDFGEDSSVNATNSTYLMLTPKAGAAGQALRCGYRYGPTASERVIDHTAAMTVGESMHLVLVWDQTRHLAQLYVNGQLSAQDTSTHVDLATMLDNNNWLGRSQWNDELFVGSYEEVRLYRGVLSPGQIAANHQAGPDVVPGFLVAARSPTPADGTADVLPPAELAWEYTADPILLEHWVYLGENEAAVAAAGAESPLLRAKLPAGTAEYTVIDLDMNTTWYWRVDEVATDGGRVTGAVWRFATANLQASEPEPADGQQAVPAQATLQWMAGYQAKSHRVQLGTDPDSMSVAAEALTRAMLQPEGLRFETTYFWRVDEEQEDGSYVAGPVWSFRTRDKPAPCLAGDLNYDCLVDLEDLRLLARQWLDETLCDGFDCPDLDGDGYVGLADMAVLGGQWGSEIGARIVINEIHYHPDSNIEPVEFVELYNASPRLVDLSGWRFSDGIEYVFPPNTTLSSGDYMVVAENPAAVLDKWGVEAMGPFEGQLNNEGERVTLRDAAGEKVDEVEYRGQFPWSVAANGEGASMELLNPDLDNDLAGSWRASGYAPKAAGAPAEGLILRESGLWRYRRGLSEPAASWMEVDYTEDDDWATGQASFGYGDDDDRTPLNDMQDSYTSVYLRHTFVLGEIPQRLELDVYVDDGCIVWLNGRPVTRLHVSDEFKSHDDVTDVADHEAEWERIEIADAAEFVHLGENVLAIHALNRSIDSSDFSIDAALTVPAVDGGEAVFGQPSPGRANAVLMNNAPPQIRQVDHDPKQPAAEESILITAKVTDPDGVNGVRLHYQRVLPGDYIPAYLPVPHNSLLSDPWQARPHNPAFEDPANWTVVAMRDDGLEGDAVAGDDVYSVRLAGQPNRMLLRYRISAVDLRGASVRVPYYDDPSLNFACFIYSGVPPYTAATRSVHPDGAGHTYPADVMTSLPVYFLLTRAEDMTECMAYNWADQQPHDDILEHQEARHYYNWEGAFVYDGKVYDHVGYRLRGANGRYDLAGKRSMKMRFNRGNYLEARDVNGRKYERPWKFLSIGKMFGNRLVGNFGLTETLNQKLWTLFGVPAIRTHWFHFRVVDGDQEAPGGYNGQYYGDFWGMFLAFESYDVRFLESFDLPKGNLYKLTDRVFEGLRQLDYQGAESVSNAEDYENIRWNLNSTQTVDWLRRHVNWDIWYRYHTVSEAIRHYDVFHEPIGRHRLKNMAWYFEPVDDNPLGRLWFLPYDSDASWGPTWNEGKDQAKAAIYDGGGKPELKQEYRNAMREFRDLLWQSEIVNPMIDELAAKIAPFVPADRDRWRNAPADAGSMDFGTLENKVADMKRFAWQGGMWPGDAAWYPGSAAMLDQLAAAEGDAASIPNTPQVYYSGPAGHPINGLVFRTTAFSDPQGSATFAAMKWRIAEVTDPTNPNYDPTEERKYEVQADWESAELTEFVPTVRIPASAVKAGRTYRVRCRMKDQTGRWSHWSPPVQFTAGPAQSDALLSSLKITEIMYNPAEADLAAGEPDVDSDEFEFIELKNVGSAVLDISGLSFTEGVEFSFDAAAIRTLHPGEFVLLVRDTAVFAARYGAVPAGRIAGEYSGKLSNDGESLALEDFWKGPVLSFAFNDGAGWPSSADGGGHSLVPTTVETGMNDGRLDYGPSWRASAYRLGSPAADDPAVEATLLINEVMAHTDYSDAQHPEYDSNDWIELVNAAAETLHLDGNWWLSDDVSEPAKWRLPVMDVPAGGVIAFDEINGFHRPITDGFGLDKAGESVVLSWLPAAGPGRIVDVIDFDGQDNDVSLGRFPDGGPWWFAMEPTQASANTAPTPHVVISEIMYHPAGAGMAEYVEIHNPNGVPVALYSAAGPWRIDGAAEFTFPDGLVLQPDARIVIVDFDPAIESTALSRFISDYQSPRLEPGVDIFGPMDGNLSNVTETLRLQRPIAPDMPGDPAIWITVDEVTWFDQSPWPVEADGLGKSLQRMTTAPNTAGSDPSAWDALLPTPAAAP